MKYYLGVDLGGTNIAAGILDEDNKFLIKKSIPTNKDRESAEIVKDIVDLCKNLINETGVEIESIGIGSPGTCDTVNKEIIYSNNLKFKNVKIAEEINKYIDIPVYLGNDANCAALGECCAGGAKGCSSSLTITLGTGVGGGCIVNNRLLTGVFFNGAEMGHMVIEYNGEQCTCGRKGCLEAYCSATALIRDIKLEAIRNPHSKLNDAVNNDINKVTPKTAFDAAEMKDEVAINLIDKYLDYLSTGITNFINIFEPEIILLGGGVSAQKDIILKPLREKVAKQVFGGNLKTKIGLAQLGNDAGIIGAAFLSKFEDV